MPMKTRYCKRCGQEILVEDSLNAMPKQIRYFRPTNTDATVEQVTECPCCGVPLGISGLEKEPKATE